MSSFMVGCAIGMSPLMFRLCVPMVVAWTPSPWLASDVLSSTSCMNA